MAWSEETWDWSVAMVALVCRDLLADLGGLLLGRVVLLRDDVEALLIGLKLGRDLRCFGPSARHRVGRGGTGSQR